MTLHHWGDLGKLVSCGKEQLVMQSFGLLGECGEGFGVSEAVDPPELKDGEEIIGLDVLALDSVNKGSDKGGLMLQKEVRTGRHKARVVIRVVEIWANRGLTNNASAFGQMVLSMSCVHSGMLDSAPISGIGARAMH